MAKRANKYPCRFCNGTGQQKRETGPGTYPCGNCAGQGFVIK